MATENQTIKLPWEVPTAAALTDVDSRADRSDVWMQNEELISG